MTFEGMTALVTGGASGLGAAIARRFLEDGARVAVLDRNVSTADERVFAVEADLTVGSSVRESVARVVERFGGLDIVVNNAGIGAAGSIETNDDDEWHRVWDVNVVGLARVTRAALPALRASGHPAIVNIGSVVATTGLPDRALYSATKAAVLALTRAMAADHLAEGIRVNCVSPGTADTPWVARLTESADDPVRARATLEARQPHGRLVSPEEIADAVAYLAGPRAGSTNGLNLVVDGGLTALRIPKS